MTGPLLVDTAPTPGRRLFAGLSAWLLVAVLFFPAAPAAGLTDALASVIVRETPGSGDTAERAVEAAGGRVGRQLPIIDGFAADLPEAAIALLATHPAIVSITPNAQLQLLGDNEVEEGRRQRGRDRKDDDKRRSASRPSREDHKGGRDRGGHNDTDDDKDGDDDDDDGHGRGDDDEDGDDDQDGDDHDSDGDDDGNPHKNTDVGSMESTAQMVGAERVWRAGFTGAGIDIAIIDSGVSPVPGLADPGKIVHGPDLSFESQAPNLSHLDTFGHGTFMAGLIGADDPGGGYAGIAPGARILSIKVADAHGATDVSQVIAAIDWVVQHRRDPGFDIRVLNLSFGTYGAQPYTLDPLAFAAEVAWHAGIFVVVSAGNDAPDSGRLMNPAMDPFVMAVGASDPSGTLRTRDDILLPSSARGDGVRNPDLVAPGRSLQGLRVVGSYVDVTFPTARLSDRFFRGTGTSQAAAIASGAAALIVDQRPQITPDQLKALLMSTAQQLPNADARGQGAGLLDVGAAFRARTPMAVQAWPRSTGTGSLELARGVNHLGMDGVPLQGEQDIFGAPFDSAAHAAAALSGTAWTGGSWNGSVWTGPGWTANEWSTVAWSGTSWSGNEWSANEWSANEWSANEWSANEWSANEWSANEWSANEWSANEWSANEWSTEGWQSMGWPPGR